MVRPLQVQTTKDHTLLNLISKSLFFEARYNLTFPSPQQPIPIPKVPETTLQKSLPPPQYPPQP